MAGKAWSATNADSIIVPYNYWRNSLMIQCHRGSSATVFIQLGQTAEASKGIELPPGSAYSVTGHKATYAVHGITSSGTATGGYEEN